MTARAWAAPALAIAAALAPAHAAAQALPFHTDTAITAGFQENAARAFLGFVGREGLVVDGEGAPDRGMAA